MDIQEFKRAKKLLERELIVYISSKTSAFTEATGVTISGLSIETSLLTIFERTPRLVVSSLKVEVRL